MCVYVHLIKLLNGAILALQQPGEYSAIVCMLQLHHVVRISQLIKCAYSLIARMLFEHEKLLFVSVKSCVQVTQKQN